MGQEIRLKELIAFVNMLKNAGVHKFDIDNFSSRVRMQKYVYLAKLFGFKHEYIYNIYLKGPYSKDLADDYYKLNKVDELEDLSEFNSEAFVELVKVKDLKWLEVATTIHFLWEKHKGLSKNMDATIVELVCNIKSHVGRPYVRKILEELKMADILEN